MFPSKCKRKEPCRYRTFGGNCFLTVCALPKPDKHEKKRKGGHIGDANKKVAEAIEQQNEPAAKGCADGLNDPTLKALSTIADMCGFEMQDL